MERIECIELDKRKKMRIFSMIGGAMFSCAWWVFISAIASVQHRQDPLQPTAVLYLPGLLFFDFLFVFIHNFSMKRMKEIIKGRESAI